MGTKKISIIVPVKNGMSTLPHFIEGVKKQTRFNETEVIVIDSGSTDASVEFLEKFDFVKIVSIDPKTFNHGATRNLGVSHCKGEFVLMTVQDATPVNELWLESMVNHFKDKAVMGGWGQQVVPHHKDKNPHEWFRPQSKGSVKNVQFKDKAKFINLTPAEQKKLCGWDDVNAMYRKRALIELPFEPLVYGEDMFWAKMALELGYKLVYDYSIRVYHYHFQFPKYTYKRILISKFFTYTCFNFSDARTYSLKNYLIIVFRNFKWGYHMKWIWHNFKIIYSHRKATKVFIKNVKNNTLEALEKELAIQIPIGKQNIKR
jgi:rhamnosyltransferase